MAALKPSLEDAVLCSPLPTGGYDDGIFINPPGEDLGVHCPVCMLVLREPHLLACCGGHLCEICIRTIKNAGRACPCCRDEDCNSLLNKEKRRVVHGLKVYCTYKDTGCTWTGELGEVERHLQKRCDHVVQDCPYGCGQSVPRHSMQDHTTRKCAKRPMEVQLECMTQDMMEKLLALETKYEEKVSILEEKIRQQDVKIIEQEAKLAKQEKQMVGRSSKQEAKLAKQEKQMVDKLTKQEAKLAKQVVDGLTKQDEKLAKQEEQMVDKLTKQEVKLARQVVDRLTKQDEKLAKQEEQMVDRLTKQEAKLAEQEQKQKAKLTSQEERLRKEFKQQNDALFKELEERIVNHKKQLSDKLAKQGGKLRREFQQQNGKLSKELKEERTKTSQVVPGNLKNRLKSLEVTSASCTENIEKVNRHLQKIKDDLFFQTEIPISHGKNMLDWIALLPSWQKAVEEMRNAEVQIETKKSSIKLQCSRNPARLRVEEATDRVRSVIASLHKRVITFPPERKEVLQHLLKNRGWLAAIKGYIGVGPFDIDIAGYNELDVVVYGKAKESVDVVCFELQSFIDNKEKKIRLSLSRISAASFRELQAFAKSKSVHIEEDKVQRTMRFKLYSSPTTNIILIGGKCNVLLVEDYIGSHICTNLLA